MLVGTSGWHYRHWRSGLYPPTLPTRQWLSRYAELFGTVELNNAFYRLPTEGAFREWREEVPADFVMAVKMSRYLTHVKRLRDPDEPVALFLSRSAGLGDRMGPVLLQLPPSLPADAAALSAVLRSFPASVRVAVEFRHPSWFEDRATRSALEARGAACCLTDVLSRPGPLWRTAPWGYVRLHRGLALPNPCYGAQALRSWAERIDHLWPRSSQVFVFFNNDGHGCAPRDASRFAVAAQGRGWTTTRAPGLSDVPLT